MFFYVSDDCRSKPVRARGLSFLQKSLWCQTSQQNNGILDDETRNSKSLFQFKHELLEIVRKLGNSTYKFCDISGVKLLKKLLVPQMNMLGHFYTVGTVPLVPLLQSSGFRNAARSNCQCRAVKLLEAC